MSRNDPWHRLADDARKLAELDAAGRHRDLLATADELHDRASVLLTAGDRSDEAPEIVEGILEAGARAAMKLADWDDAARRYEAIADHRTATGAAALAVARARLVVCGPLLSLGRLDDAANLLRDCDAVFHAEEAAPAEMADLCSYLALLADRQGRPGDAIAHETAALVHRYAAGLTACALNHYNLASHLMRGDAARQSALDHRLAALVIAYAADMAELPAMLAGFARHLTAFSQKAPRLPRTFQVLCERVGQIEGVDLAGLVAGLPDTEPDEGDAALDEVLGRGRPKAKPPEGPMSPGVRDAVHGCLLNLAIARLSGVRPRDVDKVKEGVRQLIDSVAPGNDEELDGLFAKLDADPEALRKEMEEALGEAK